MYKIFGKDRRYGFKECYGEFNNLKDCLFHLNTLKSSTMDNHTKFYYKKIN